MKHILGLIAILSLVGCAGSNQGMQSQVDALRERTHLQEKEIAELQAKAAKMKEQAATTSQSVWDWTSQKAQDAWGSQFSVETRARFERCWDELRHGKQ